MPTTKLARNASCVIAFALAGIGLDAAAIAPYYAGFTAFAAPTCSSADGGTITTGTRTFVWSTPLGGAVETRVDSVNGVPVFAPAPYDATAGSGLDNFGGFANTELGPYPFTYTFQFTTSQGGTLISLSTASITCVADGPGTTSFIIGSPPPNLENPQPFSSQGGIGLFSGWSCVGPFVGIGIDGSAPIIAPYGSSRADTAIACGLGNINTGFGLLFNYNNLGTGNHTARLYVNGQAIGPATAFQVTVIAGEFLIGASKLVTVPDFPSPGRTTTLIWQQSQQNFAIHSVTP